MFLIQFDLCCCILSKGFINTSPRVPFGNFRLRHSCFTRILCALYTKTLSESISSIDCSEQIRMPLCFMARNNSATLCANLLEFLFYQNVYLKRTHKAHCLCQLQGRAMSDGDNDAMSRSSEHQRILHIYQVSVSLCCLNT